MSDFESTLLHTIKSKIIRDIDNLELVTINSKNKLPLPKEIIEECWKQVNVDEVKAIIIERLEEEIAERVVNAIISEVATDIKRSLSDKNVRDNVRSFCQGKIKEIVNGDQ